MQGVKAVAEIDLARPDVATRGQAWRGRSLFEWTLRVDEVAHLEAQATPRGYLFRSQLAADFEFDLDSHPYLRSLFGVERLIQGEVGFAQAAVGCLSFGLVLFEDRTDALALFRRQAKLVDGIFHWRHSGFLRVNVADRREEQQESGEDE